MKENGTCSSRGTELERTSSTLLSMHSNEQIFPCHISNENMQSFKSQTNPKNWKYIAIIVRTLSFFEQICRCIEKRMSVPKFARPTLNHKRTIVNIQLMNRMV